MIDVVVDGVSENIGCEEDGVFMKGIGEKDLSEGVGGRILKGVGFRMGEEKDDGEGFGKVKFTFGLEGGDWGEGLGTEGGGVKTCLEECSEEACEDLVLYKESLILLFLCSEEPTLSGS